MTSPEDFDTAQQALLGAQHAAAGRERGLEQADWRYTQKQQTAPAAGLVYDTYYRPGEWVAAGTPVLSLLPPGIPEGAVFRAGNRSGQSSRSVRRWTSTWTA